MSVRPLHDLWEAAAGQPYEPSVSKDSQFTLGISLLFIGIFLRDKTILQDIHLPNNSSHSLRLLQPEYAT